MHHNGHVQSSLNGMAVSHKKTNILPSQMKELDNILFHNAEVRLNTVVEDT